MASRALARYGLPGGLAETDDQVQALFAQLLAGNAPALSAFDGRIPLRSYLSVLLIRQVQKAARGRRLLPLPAAWNPASGAPAPDEAAQTREEILRVLDLLPGLPPREGLALRLQAQGASNAEIARILGTGASHTRVVLSRALQSLRKRMGKSGKTP